MLCALGLTTAAHAEEPRRIAWAGLMGGALAPLAAQALEGELIEALGAQGGVLLVDAGGRPLGRAARALEVARVTRLLREGVDAMLHERHEEGRARIDRAVALFESMLGTHDDHHALHDALLAQAESLFAVGKVEAARTTLERLRALSPDLAPEEPRGLVALWKQVVATKPRLGRLEIEAAAGATVFVDGRALGAPPAVVPKIALGEHLVGVSWHDVSVSQTVQVAAGRPLVVSIQRPELPERARSEVADAVATRLGPTTVAGAIPKLATMANATEVVVGVVRPEGMVFLVRHGADGALRRTAGAALDTDATARAAGLAAAVLPEGMLGGYRVSATGDAIGWPAAASEAYGGAAPAPPVALAGVREGPREAWSAPELEPVESPSMVSSPWFWAVIGVVIAGGVTTGVVLATRPSADSTVVNVILPSGLVER